MAPEEDPDEALVVDWRAGSSYAENLIVAPLPQQQQQSILPFKQKKATSSGAMATNNKVTRIADATAECMIVVKNESSLKASGGGGGDRIAAPVFYELSDSEGTPVRSRPPARRPAEQIAAMAKPSISWKEKANPGLVRSSVHS